MFSLHFFSYGDLTIGEVHDALVNNKIDGVKIDAVFEGDFDTMADAIHRLNNIGSRWIFYPNAYILKDGELFAILFDSGLNLYREDFQKFFAVAA
jgi:hypothetical protein